MQHCIRFVRTGFLDNKASQMGKIRIGYIQRRFYVEKVTMSHGILSMEQTVCTVAFCRNEISHHKNEL